MLTATSQCSRFLEETARAARIFGLAGDLLQSLNRATGAGFHSLLMQHPEWDCCTCANAAGGAVALEIEEWPGAEPGLRPHGPHAVFGSTAQDELTGQVGRVLRNMDAKPHHRAQFAETVASIFVEEPGLPFERAARLFAGISFGPCRRITSAFLLLPYDPQRAAHPVVQLALKR